MENLEKIIREFLKENKIEFDRQLPNGIWEVHCGKNIVYMSPSAYEEYNKQFKKLINDEINPPNQ